MMRLTGILTRHELLAHDRATDLVRLRDTAYIVILNGDTRKGSQHAKGGAGLGIRYRWGFFRRNENHVEPGLVVERNLVRGRVTDVPH